MHDERWRIALTEPNREKLAIDGLLRIGIPSYLPIVLTKRACGRRQRIIERPMFVGYLLVKFSTAMSGWGRIFSTPGLRVTNPLLMQGDDFAVLSEEQVSAIAVKERQLKGEKNALIKQMGLEEGQQVRIPRGTYADLLGKIEDLDDDERVGVLLSLLGKDHKVWIPASELAI